MHMGITKVCSRRKITNRALRHLKQKMQKTKTWMCSDRHPHLRLRHHASKGQSDRTRTVQPCMRVVFKGKLPATKQRDLLKKKWARRIHARTKIPRSILLVELKNLLRQMTQASIKWFSRHPKANCTPAQMHHSRALSRSMLLRSWTEKTPLIVFSNLRKVTIIWSKRTWKRWNWMISMLPPRCIRWVRGNIQVVKRSLLTTLMLIKRLVAASQLQQSSAYSRPTRALQIWQSLV